MNNSLFGVYHLIMIAVSIALIVGLYFLARRLSLKTVCKVFFAVGIVSEIVKIFFYIIRNEATHGGLLPKNDLPFHLCSIQIIFIAIIVLFNNEKVKRFLLSFMLPSCLFGGIAAILIATDSARNAPIITAQYFIYHSVLVVFSLYLFTSKEFKIEIKDYFNCLKFLVVLMFFSIYINSIVSDPSVTTNFMYVVKAPQSGLPYLNTDHGWFVYIVHYALLILFCVSLCYVKPIVCAIKNMIKNHNDKKEVSLSVAVTKDENDSE